MEVASAALLVGATATGKSALAMHLAEGLGGELVNADALQVYRGLDIGTAKPPPGDRLRVPHHLIDILDPTERYSAGEFARRARSLVPEIRGRGRVPILVGGSGLYLRAYARGLSSVPRSDPGVREALGQRLRRTGLERLRRDLELLDPPTAARLARGDSQRTLRALEVVYATGHPFSWWLRRSAGTAPVPVVRIGLTLPRPILYARISERARRMVAQGWVEEVEGLLGSGIDPAAPAFQAIGYRQLVRHVRGEQSLDEALEEIITATCRYAKRQTTWFRGTPGVHWFDAREVGGRTFEIVNLMLERGLGRAQ